MPLYSIKHEQMLRQRLINRWPVDLALTIPSLYGASLVGASLYASLVGGANLDGVKPATPEQAIANLDKVREIIIDNAALLKMDHWHDESSEWKKHTCAEEAVCGTTHCLAGWLQICSTDEKVRNLEPAVAGLFCAPVASKMFYRKESEVLEWLGKRSYAKAAA